MKSRLLIIISIFVAIVSIPILLGFHPQFDFEDNSGPMPTAVVIENLPDSCSYDMILHLEKNSNMASDAEEFGLSVTNFPENVDIELWHQCLIELDSMINKQNTEMSEKINEVLVTPCEETTIQPEWSEPNEYTRAYDKRYVECRMAEMHEEPQLVKLDGNRYYIDLELNNAKVTDSEFSKNSNSLILNLDTINDGVISITIPRDLYNYPEEIPKGTPFILQNGEEIEYADSSNEINFIIQFNFTHPNPTIEIIGTFYP